MLRDVTCTLVAHAPEDGQRVRVTGLGPHAFDVVPSNTLLATLGNHGVAAPPEGIVRRLLGEQPNLAARWVKETARLHRLDPHRYPTFKVSTHPVETVNAILSGYGKPIS